MAKFNKLDVPHQWKDEFTKYPHGYTIFEALCKWVKQVDNMVDNINNWNTYLDNFVESFEFELQAEVQSTIERWQSEGLLDDIIGSALNTELDNVKAQLVETVNNANSKSYNIMFPPKPLAPAKGDGVTDDSQAIQELYNAIPDGSTLEIPAGKFYIKNTLNFNRNISIKGVKGQSFFISDGNIPVIIVSGSLVKETLISEPLPVGDKIKVVDSENIHKHQLVVIQDNSKPWPFDSRGNEFYGEVNEVKSVNTSNNEIVCYMKTADNYSNNAVVKFYNPIQNIEISGVSFIRKSSGGNSAIALVLSYTKNILVKNVSINGYGATGIADNYSSANVYQNVTISNANYVDTPTSYGIQTNGSVYTQINDSHFFDCRRGVDLSGGIPSRYIKVQGCSALGSPVSADEASGFGTHGPAEYCTFENCTIYNTKNAFVIRGCFITVKNCNSYGTVVSFASYGSGYGHLIEGCSSDKPYQSDYTLSSFVYVNSPNYSKGEKSLTIKDCYARVSSRFIDISSKSLIEQLYVKNTIVMGRGKGTTNFIISGNYESPHTTLVELDNVTTVTRTGKDMGYNIIEGTNHSIILKNPNVMTTISEVPIFLGQIAVVNGTAYIATDTESTSGWKQITNTL